MSVYKRSRRYRTESVLIVQVQVQELLKIFLKRHMCKKEGTFSCSWSDFPMETEKYKHKLTPDHEDITISCLEVD